ncbi:MAG: hypothetical protein MUP97_11850 [Acidimicrobiia bacterium]|nr:hypothetical protein [Acidimicrobiia bacterium]
MTYKVPVDREHMLVDMKRAMRERTKLLSPVIYLDGDEPRIVREYAGYP